jgi:hypothetical protein
MFVFLLGWQEISLSQDANVERIPLSNLDVTRLLAQRIGSAIAFKIPHVDSSSVLLSVFPRESAWLIDQALFSGFVQQGLHVVASGQTQFTADIGLTDTKIEYTNLRRDGWFGHKIMDRRVSLLLSTKVVSASSGSIITSSDVREQHCDTIAVSDLSNIENPTLPLTRGVLPSEGLFSNVVEPFVLLGAIAVAVFLLFNVRS